MMLTTVASAIGNAASGYYQQVGRNAALPPPPPNIVQQPRRRGRRPQSQRLVQQAAPRPNPAALPSAGRRRRRGARGTPAMVGGLRCVDTEVFTHKKDFQVMTFCPGSSGLPRLDAEAAKYSRWTLNRVTITFESAAVVTDVATFTYGILPGMVVATLDKAGITKLRPFVQHAAYKNGSITVTKSIMSQPYLYCSGTDADAVAFCLYINAGAEGKGVFKVSYDVSLAFPKP